MYALVLRHCVGLALGVVEITYFGLVVSSVLHPLKPPFSRTSFSCCAGRLLDTFSKR